MYSLCTSSVPGGSTAVWTDDYSNVLSVITLDGSALGLSPTRTVHASTRLIGDPRLLARYTAGGGRCAVFSRGRTICGIERRDVHGSLPVAQSCEPGLDSVDRARQDLLAAPKSHAARFKHVDDSRQDFLIGDAHGRNGFNEIT